MGLINFSFIIPHKNTPDLLVRCINSVPPRDDIEIIVVDDASDDSIVDFQNFPGISNPRVKLVFINESKGAGAARNEGLKYATGKWILFSDADDFFNFCLNSCLDEYINSDSDIIYFKANSLDTYTYINTYRSLQINKFIDLYNQNKEKANLLLRFRFGEPWAKIIRKAVIDDKRIRFDETIIHNDTMFSLLSGFYAAKIQIDFRAIYCCTSRMNSISYSNSKDKRLDRVWVFARVENFFNENKIGLRKINKHIISLTYFLFSDINYFKKALKVLKELGFPKWYLFYKMMLTLPYFILDMNKTWIRRILYKFL